MALVSASTTGMKLAVLGLARLLTAKKRLEAPRAPFLAQALVAQPTYMGSGGLRSAAHLFIGV
jgi:hypothetical protein